MSLRVKELTDPIYEANTLLLYGTIKELEAYGKGGEFESVVVKALTPPLDVTYRGMFATICRKKPDRYFRLIFVRSDCEETLITAVHETLHATADILLDHGMILSRESDEAFTSYQSFLMRHLLVLMKTPNKKRRTKQRLKKK